MQTILQKQFVFTPQDDKTTIPLQFSLADPIQGLRIAFQYGPQNVEPIRAQALITAELQQAGLHATPAAVAAYLPLQNLVTISVVKDGQYLGNHHYKATDQIITLTTAAASLGFAPPHQLTGDWQINLHQHCIASEQVRAAITISELEANDALL